MKTLRTLMLVACCALFAISCSRQDARAQLADACKEINSACPTQLDYLTTLTNVEYDYGDEYFVYNYLVDESVVSIELLEENLGNIVDEVLESLRGDDPDIKAFLDACIQADVDLLYVYHGDQTGDSCHFTYDPETKQFYLPEH